jgi:hypothetical protein
MQPEAASAVLCPLTHCPGSQGWGSTYWSKGWSPNILLKAGSEAQAEMVVVKREPLAGRARFARAHIGRTGRCRGACPAESSNSRIAILLEHKHPVLLVDLSMLLHQNIRSFTLTVQRKKREILIMLHCMWIVRIINNIIYGPNIDINADSTSSAYCTMSNTQKLSRLAELWIMGRMILSANNDYICMWFVGSNWLYPIWILPWK